MAQNITKIKKRINTISSTRKITNSMKLVSGVKVRKLTKEYNSNKEFFNELNLIFNEAIYLDNFKNKEELVDTIYFASPKDATKNLYIIVMSNMGLCGSYNSSLYKFFESIYKNGDEVVIIGNKARSYFKKDIIIYDDFINLTHSLNVENIWILANFVLNKFNEREYKSINCVFAKYINSLVFKPQSLTLLPLNLKENKPYNGYGPIFEANKDEFINLFIPMYLKNKLLNIFYESSLCEETSRRNSMDNANKNIDDLMYDLNIEYNKARQSEITNQISEVISGSESIKNS